MTLNVIAIIDARQEHASVVENALREMLDPTRAEDGCLQYDLNRDIDQPNRLVMIERWRDDAALDRHTNTPHMARLRRAMEGRVERSVFCRVVRLN